MADRRSSVAFARPGSIISMLSVISSSSSRASTPRRSSSSGISAASWASRKERAERFTATPSSSPPARAVAVELRLEHHVAAAALLGRVHGDVGALVELLDVLAVQRIARDADARIHLQREPLDAERLAQPAEQALGDDRGVPGALEP